MPSVVTRSPQAFRDLDAIAAFIQLDNPDAAHRFLQAAEEAFQLLAAFPRLGQAYPHPAHPRLRIWPIGKRFRKYAVFYQVNDDDVYVVRVLHGAQDLTRVLSE